MADRNGNFATCVSEIFQRRKDSSSRIFEHRGIFAEYMSGFNEHGLSDFGGFTRDDAKTYAWKDIDIIALCDVPCFAIKINRVKWAAGCNDGSAICPSDQILRLCL